MQENSNAKHENHINGQTYEDLHRGHMHANRYPEEQKRQVVSYCLGHHPEYLGKPLSALKVSKLTGINQATISKWLKRYGSEVKAHPPKGPTQLEMKQVVTNTNRSENHKDSNLLETVDKLNKEIETLSQQIVVMEKVIVNYAIKFSKKDDFN